MKYIKNFENLEIDKRSEELNNICFEYLAFLYDEGFSTQITKLGFSSNEFEVSIVKYKKLPNSETGPGSIEIRGTFRWLDIKDDIIPFYEILKDKYTLVDYFGSKANYPAYIEIYTSTEEFYVCDYELEDLKFENILSITFRVFDIKNK